jgi:dTDP-4-dehydrorhamnose reductase
MKILIFGSNGMAGHVIQKYLQKKGHDIDTVARADAKFNLDIEDIKLTNQFLLDIKDNYDFIINCVGLLVKDSLDRPDRAILINSWFPHAIENAIKDTKTRLIHLSTDCVFDGSKGNYIESDVHTEINYYGKSKSLGEVNNQKDITFRMSIIGPELKNNGTGLLHWILNSSDKNLNGWENAWWNGITTLQLAKCIEKYISNPTISRIYNLVNNDVKINKYELLCKVNEIYNLEKNIIKTNGPKTVNKVLVDTRKLIDFEIPNYDIQLKELKEFSL